MTTKDTRKGIVIRFNNRNYNPGEWEAWRESAVLAHCPDLNTIMATYPNASVSVDIEYADGDSQTVEFPSYTQADIDDSRQKTDKLFNDMMGVIDGSNKKGQNE